MPKLYLMLSVNYIMEFIEIAYLIIISMVPISGIIILYHVISPNKQKRARKMIMDESFGTMKDEYSKMKVFYEDKCKTLEKELRHWRGRATRLEYFEDEEEGEVGKSSQKRISKKNLEEHYEIDINSALPLVKSLKESIPFLKDLDDSKLPELINNPIAKKYAWDYIKKNKDEMISLGVIVPIGQSKKSPDTNEKETETSKEKADNTMSVYTDDELMKNTSNMA